ncbi:MAG TPA: hypothetical protein VEW69_11500 [Alphaproteobacteria bacterium]|nr:hypothetical protein [Alphaproteobacteria bacterium]
MKKSLFTLAAGLMAISTAAFAGTTATNTNTVSPTLQVSANIQKAVQLTLLTGTSTAAHCTVTPAGGAPDYTMNFGNVDALGINAPTCGSVFAPATPGVSNAIYWSDYNLKPVFTSHATTNASTITAYVSTNFAGNNISMVRDSANSATVPGSAAAFTAMSTAVGAQDTLASGAGITSGTAITRFIGVSIAPTNGAGIGTGAQTATVTFTLTIN